MFSFFKRKKIQKQTYLMKAASTSGSVGVRKSLNSNFTESRVYNDDSSDIMNSVVTATVINEIMTPDPVYISTDSGYSSSSSDYSGGGGDFGGGGSSGDW